MSDLADLALYYLFGYALPFGVLLAVAYPLILSGRWRTLDWFAVAVPGLVWVALMYIDERGRGWTNVLVEPPLLALSVAIAAGFRSRLPARFGRLLPGLGLFIAGILSCLGFYYFMPRLGE